MFKRRTVFVVGAGASHEFGLPVGWKLAQNISKMMDIRFERTWEPIGEGDFDLYRQITRGLQKDVREFHNAAWLIRDGIQLARSIDDFLDLHRNDPFVVTYGKAAIVRSVLQAERNSKLHYNRATGTDTFSPAKVADTWLVKLMQMLAPGIPLEKVRSIFNNISFIVFNYDRCIEFFLEHALQQLYGIDEQLAEEIVGELQIEHPYGMIDPAISFGSSGGDYAKLAAGIKTYTEQVQDVRMIETVESQIEAARHIVFLGFAYHDQNMDILRPPEQISAERWFYGTAYGLSDSDVNVVSHQIGGWLKGVNSRVETSLVKIDNRLTCARLFDHYAKSLTARD